MGDTLQIVFEHYMLKSQEIICAYFRRACAYKCIEDVSMKVNFSLIIIVCVKKMSHANVCHINDLNN